MASLDSPTISAITAVTTALLDAWNNRASSGGVIIEVPYTACIGVDETKITRGPVLPDGRQTWRMPYLGKFRTSYWRLLDVNPTGTIIRVSKINAPWQLTIHTYDGKMLPVGVRVWQLLTAVRWGEGGGKGGDRKDEGGAGTSSTRGKTFQGQEGVTGPRWFDCSQIMSSFQLYRGADEPRGGWKDDVSEFYFG